MPTRMASESPGRNETERGSGLENEKLRRPSPQPEGKGSVAVGDPDERHRVLVGRGVEERREAGRPVRADDGPEEACDDERERRVD